MKKIHYRIILVMIFAVIILFASKSESKAAYAGISASSTNVTVGDSVNINVSVNAATWNVKVNGSGIADSIVGVNMNVQNEATNKSYKLNTSKAGRYTVSLSGDVTDASGASSKAAGSVTVNVAEKAVQPQQNTNAGSNNQNNNNTNSNANANTNTNTNQNTQKPAEPTFSNVNQTVYAINEGINVRSSYSTSSGVVGSLKKGDSVQRTGIGSNGWSKVSYNGQTAYISSSLLTATKPVVEEQKQEENKEEEQKQEEKQPEVSSNKALKDLVVEDYKLTPDFDPENTKYSLTLKNEDDKLNIKATPQDENAKVDITGNENFTIGNNLVKITVTATDGTTRMYTIAVSKSNEETEKDMLKLSNLKVNGATLSPEFSRDVTNYEITVDDPTTIKAENVVAVPVDTGVEVTVAEESKTENGEKVITIMLENEDGTKTGVYQIAVKKTPSNPIAAIQNSAKNNDNKIYYILGGIMAALVILIIIIAVLLKRTSNEDDDDINDADELSDDYDYSLKNAIDQANGNAESENEYDEMVEKSNVKSQIINPTDYNVFKDVNDEVGVDKIQDDEDYTPDLKLKKKGKHF